MTLRPEQQLAIAYAQRAGTKAPKDKIRGKVAKTFTDIEALLDEIPEAAAKRKPAPEAWSVHEIVDHLVESHRPGVEELEMLIRGESPTTGPVPAGLVSDRPFDIPWPELIDRLKAVHRDLLTAFDRATDDTPTEAKAAVAMVVKCKDEDGVMRPVHWEQSFDWKAYIILLRAHTLEHLQQVHRVLDN
jgi:hypothetical protein